MTLRRLLHERAEQGRTASAGELVNAGDGIRLRAELAQLANRLSGEMAEVLTCPSCAESSADCPTPPVVPQTGMC